MEEDGHIELINFGPERFHDGVIEVDGLGNIGSRGESVD